MGTHTHANLEVSEKTFCEVARKLRAAGYEHAFGPDGMLIDMHGIALKLDESTVGKTTNFAWVIERADSEPSEPQYFVKPGEWSYNHAKALRFARQQDAEVFADEHRVAEHGWEEQ